ncbi:MAG: MarR family transcriptional regulator [Paracoccaceae bacterium]|nr:MarR family transcriptional regulator [Paracoccaceae bacterium]
MVDDIVRQIGYLALGSRLRRIGERLQAETYSLIAARGIPLQGNHYPLLFALEESGPLTIGDLATALGISQPGVTRIVGQLTRLGAVSARSGKSDQRQKVVSLTEKGKTLVELGRQEIWPQVLECITDILDGQRGPILDQLDHLEDALQAQSFLDRVNAKTGGGQNG